MHPSAVIPDEVQHAGVEPRAEGKHRKGLNLGKVTFAPLASAYTWRVGVGLYLEGERVSSRALERA